MSPRLTMKQKLEHQAAYIKQLEKVKEEYDSLKEFIFRHMCSMIPEKEEDLDYIHSAEIGDYLLSNIDATGLRKGSQYHIYDVTNKLIRYMDDDNCPKSYVKIFPDPEYKKRFTLIKNYNK